MKFWLPATALSVALTLTIGIPSSAQAFGTRGGVSAGAALHPLAAAHRFHHGFGLHARLFRTTGAFLQPRLNFGAGFASQPLRVVGGLNGNSDYASGDYGLDTDDIENLHFRVQEPFGPGDIGKRPLRAEEDVPCMEDRVAPRPGYGPEG